MRCARCGEPKPLAEFRRLTSGSWSSYCRECARQCTREWRARNRDEINAGRRTAYRAARAQLAVFGESQSTGDLIDRSSRVPAVFVGVLT